MSDDDFETGGARSTISWAIAFLLLVLIGLAFVAAFAALVTLVVRAVLGDL